jgi:ABC-type maltose transport system permease subunit
LQTTSKSTLPLGLYGYINTQFAQHWGPFAAGVLIAAVPAALLFTFLQRYIVQGLTAGSVKG